LVIKQIATNDLNPREIREASNEVGVLKLLDHPSIIGYHTSFTENDTLHIVMELAEGLILQLKSHMIGGDLNADIIQMRNTSNVYPESVTSQLVKLTFSKLSNGDCKLQLDSSMFTAKTFFTGFSSKYSN
jgi:serine/threonine protein kinase